VFGSTTPTSATFTSCAFINNQASGLGGAVYLNANSRTTFLGSLFQDNAAPGRDYYGGGAISCDGCAKLHVLSSIFKDNICGPRGGAISAVGSGSDDFLVDSSTFVN
jgi:predicted outer membrane repeat protein